MDLARSDYIETAMSKDPLCATCIGLLTAVSFDWLPTDDTQFRAVVAKLHSVAQDHAHARVIVRGWADTQRKFPAPCDIESLANETRVRETLPPGCDTCHGEPFVMGDDGVMGRCVCKRGDALGGKAGAAGPRTPRW